MKNDFMTNQIYFIYLKQNENHKLFEMLKGNRNEMKKKIL